MASNLFGGKRLKKKKTDCLKAMMKKGLRIIGWIKLLLKISSAQGNRWLSQWKVKIYLLQHTDFPRLLKLVQQRVSQLWVHLSIAIRCCVCIVWVNTVSPYHICAPLLHAASLCWSTGLLTWVPLPGEHILELFNLHGRCFSGFNVSALLSPLSKARCCWCGSLRFKGAFKVLSGQNPECYTGCLGCVIAVIWFFISSLILFSLNHGGFSPL